VNENPYAKGTAPQYRHGKKICSNILECEDPNGLYQFAKAHSAPFSQSVNDELLTLLQAMKHLERCAGPLASIPHIFGWLVFHFAIASAVRLTRIEPENGRTGFQTDKCMLGTPGALFDEPLQQQDIGPHLLCTGASPGFPSDAFSCA